MSVKPEDDIKKEVLKRYGNIVMFWLNDLSNRLKFCYDHVERLKNELEDFIIGWKGEDIVYNVTELLAEVETCGAVIKTYSNMIARGIEKVIEVKYNKR